MAEHFTAAGPWVTPVDDDLLREIGRLTIAWNKAETALKELVWLYLGTDAFTASIITNPMRGNDCENLLKKLVEEKEADPAIVGEVLASIQVVKDCRQNRNIIVHNLGACDGTVTTGGRELIANCAATVSGISLHLAAIREQISRIFIQREMRETPDGELTGPSEDLPDFEFAAPLRPERPRQLRFGELIGSDDDDE